VRSLSPLAARAEARSGERSASHGGKGTGPWVLGVGRRRRRDVRWRDDGCFHGNYGGRRNRPP